jgi:hypothetical protein
MSRRTRIVLAVLGLALVLLSLAALGYAFRSVETLQGGATLAPTLFTLPVGGAP